MLTKLTLAAAAALTAFGLPAAAQAQYYGYAYDDPYDHYGDRYDYGRDYHRGWDRHHDWRRWERAERHRERAEWRAHRRWERERAYAWDYYR